MSAPAPAPALVHRRVRLDDLVPDPRNARLHDAANVAAIEASFREFGQAEPLVVQTSTRRVIAGHGRLEALRKLGWAEVDVVMLDIDDRKARALGVALNRTAELSPGWNEQELAALLQELQAEDRALMSATGFSDGNLAALLRDPDADPSGGPSLADRFLVPPFTVLDARAGYWQERKRRWLALGIRSELGRADGVPGGSARPAAQVGADGRTRRGDGAGRLLKTWNGVGQDDPVSRRIADAGAACSVFDPVLCELVYRWFSPPGGRVLDPFAGGSVRGIVAARLGRPYTGIELRPEQVAANREQGAALVRAGDPASSWVEGDAREARALLGNPCPVDLIFSCPPYADLERYSDDPRDLSTMDYPAFLDAFRVIVAESLGLLAEDRFAVFVVGDVRHGRDGLCRGFVAGTARAFEDAGARLYNHAVLVTMVGSLSLRAGRQFSASRKLGTAHQHVLVFVKGDPRRAAEACGPIDVSSDADGLDDDRPLDQETDA